MNFRDKYFKGYIRTIGYIQGSFPRNVKKSYFINTFICIFLLPFQRYEYAKYLFSGNKNSRFFSGVDDISRWGVSIPFKKLNLGLAQLYIVTALYTFASRRFVKIYRCEIVRLRNKMRPQPPDCIYVHSDALPFVRSLMLVLKPLKTKFICVQHGIFHNALPGEIDGSYSHVNIIMNWSQKQVFESSGAKVDLIWEEVCQIENQTDLNRMCKFHKVVIVGGALHTASKRLDAEHLATSIQIKKNLEKLGLNVYYRPHPRDKISLLRMVKLRYLFRNISLSNDIEGTLYIGADSSHLYRVASNGGYAVKMSSYQNVDNNSGMEHSVIDAKKLVEMINKSQLEEYLIPRGFFCLEYNVDKLIEKVNALLSK
ncbi:hypothetical protein OAD42_02700 [Oceanospirillaceae bacterium]|nr:hypothetical protein [Oceanospirillaceae bacterium]